MLTNVKLSQSIILLLIITTMGCVTPMGMTSSSTPLHNRVIVENLGSSEGTDWSWSLFGLWSVGRPDIDKAINEAIASKNGDTLINVRWYEKSYYFIFFSINKIIVTGQVVKTTTSDIKDASKQKR